VGVKEVEICPEYGGYHSAYALMVSGYLSMQQNDGTI